ncbi:GGDEF domain-containing protein [Novosphingobium taihuense]|uniref:GGDEF domain-containing protein n=1 Tax=Novosphingobium taihuense TaxID=260085 RepID=UPI00215D5107|nr:diguanylate cyclase [Novosphingobium taihuense]
MGNESVGGLRLLRLFAGGQGPSATNDHNDKEAALSPQGLAHKILLDEISTFLLDNALPVTASNLLAAHSAFSGLDTVLARRILERRASGLGITQEWLDLNKTPDGMQEGVKKIMGSLEVSLDSFASTTRTARDAAAKYNSAIEAQVSRARAPNAESPLAALEILAKEMIVRTQRFAAEMKRSEDEAQALRRELDKARHDAEVDHLTGLPNRRAFEAVLDHHYREARQEADNLCVAFCDIDHFKRVNDTHGHDTGDRVIRAVGEALARISNDKCHVARHGGEEFVVLFRGKTAEEAFVTLDGVRENFGSRAFVNRSNDKPIGQITFSGGIADVFAYTNPREALKAADEALYRAKSSGRNQIVLSSLD